MALGCWHYGIVWPDQGWVQRRAQPHIAPEPWAAHRPRACGAAATAVPAAHRPLHPCAPPCRKVQGMLRKSGREDVSVEIVFPVSPEAITTEGQASHVAGQVGGSGPGQGGAGRWHPRGPHVHFAACCISCALLAPVEG